MERPSFLDQEPPPGYIPGIGRGATGFTTRSDVGSGRIPSRLQNDREKPLDGIDSGEQDENDKPARSHKFADPNGLSLASENLDKDDEEADLVYSQIDAKLSHRKKDKKKTGVSNIQHTNNIHSFSEQFVDLKRSLATVSEEQWKNIPEAGDITRKNKRQRLEMQNERKTYVAPDALLSSNVNLTKLTEEREKLLGHQLDTYFQEKVVTGSENDNDQHDSVTVYLKELEKSTSATETSDQVQDLKKMRTILQSYRRSDPKKPHGWIASARLEEKAKKFQLAKSLIDQGCQECPRNQEIWLENIRLNSSNLHYCKVLVTNAIKFNDQSLDLWLKAIELESEDFNKIRVIRKALKHLPESETLWKLAVQYENDKIEAVKILVKATELVPKSMDLWMALVSLQSHPEARKTLNSARKLMPGEHQVWILAAQLEERGAEAPLHKLVNLLTKGIKELIKNGRTLTINDWLFEAERIEEEASALYPNTIAALVKASMSLEFDIESDDAVRELTQIVKGMEDTHYITKSSIYQYFLEHKPAHFSFWRDFIKLCERLSKMEDIYSTWDHLLFGENNKTLTEHPVLCLMYSKMVWKTEEDIKRAIRIIELGIERLPFNVDFWLAKTKLLTVNGQIDETESTFSKAFQSVSDAERERLHYRYVSFLRFKGDNIKALEFLDNNCLGEYPACDKFYLQKGQIYHDLKEYNKARECYSIGTKKISQSIPLWISLANLDEQELNKPTIARSDFDLAIIKNPDSDLLYVEKAKMEARLGNKDQARLIVSQALKKFPKSAHLWVENMKLVAKKSLKRSMFQDALKNTENACQVLVEIGLSFYNETQYDKALKWFERSTKTNPQQGDSWVWLYRCYLKLEKDTRELLSSVDETEPRYGKLWTNVSKNVKTQYFKPSDILVTICSNK